MCKPYLNEHDHLCFRSVKPKLTLKTTKYDCAKYSVTIVKL